MHLATLFDRSVRMYPDYPALSGESGKTLTYQQLQRRVRSLSAFLTEDLGLSPGSRVTLAMKNCQAYVEALLAIWSSRLCAVPVNSKLHPSEVDYILRDSQSALCLSAGSIHDQLLAHLPDAPLLDVEGERWLSAAVAGRSPRGSQPYDARELAWLFYTSGTTGKPKGVMLAHHQLATMTLFYSCDVQPIEAGNVLLHLAPISHGSGLCGVAYMCRGGHQVIPASGGFEEEEVFEALRKMDNVSFFAAPTMLHRLVESARTREQFGPQHYPGLHTIVAGGAPFYVEDIKASVACFGPRIAQMYGQGETPLSATAMNAYHMSKAVEVGDEMALASVGFPQTGVELQIQGEEGEVLPPGQSGEIVLRAATVMNGYWRNPEGTTKTLRNGWLWTGDVGFVDSHGRLHLKDRTKDVIISGGTNIYPREVEEALLKHPSVREVSVIGYPDPEWGESVMAIVVADGVVGSSDLEATCVENIARFKRPKRYLFVDSLPKSPNGKVLKTELRKQFGARSNG